MVKDLVGQRFGKLTVIKQAGYTKVNKWGSRYALWLCKCDCGNDCTMDTGTLKRQGIDYIKFHNLYLGQDSKKLGFSFKSLWGKELMMLKEHFPDDYEKVIRLYPFAGAGVKREEEYGKQES